MSRRPLSAEDLVGPEWAAWYALSPLERWEASQRLWAEYLALDGSLDPDIDTQSPFWSDEDLTSFARRTTASERSRQLPTSRPGSDS